MSDTNQMAEQVKTNILGVANDQSFLGLTNIWLREAIHHNYAQNFTWLGRPIIQVPQDIYAIQELIWKLKPDLIIETGIAHGGSLIMSASMLALLDYADAVQTGESFNPKISNRKVLGIDIDIRSHNRKAIEEHPMTHLIEMIEGSSIDANVIKQVNEKAKGKSNVLIFLDSNHTHDHVLAELEAYASLVPKGGYCVVWDTGVEDLPEGFCNDRPWGKGNNPMTAVKEYLAKLNTQQHYGRDGELLIFKVDEMIENKLAITASRSGFLTRI